MNLTSVETLVLGLAVFGLVLYRQLRPQPVHDAKGAKRVVVFALVGIVLVGRYLTHHPVTGLSVAALSASLVVAAGLSYLRGRSVALWNRDGEWWRRGTVRTLVLWALSMGSHVGIDAFVAHLDPSAKGLGNATIMIYLAVSLGLQQLVVLRRVQNRRVDPATTAVRTPIDLAG